MEVALQNIKEIQNYLASAYSTSFNQLASNIKNQISRVQGVMDALKAKGVTFQKQIKQLEEKPAEEPEEDEEEPEPGFFTAYIINPIASIFSGIWNGIKTVWNFAVGVVMWPFQKIFGWGQEPEEIEEEVVEQEVTVEVPVKQ